MTNNLILASKFASEKTTQLYRDNVKIFQVILILLTIYVILVLLSSTIYAINQYILFILWWFILGVLATIGLGTGMYTGTFYLFPFILRIKSQTEICGNTDFSLIDFECKNNNNQIDYTQLDILSKSMAPILIWSAGTCIGEIPPFLMARFAKGSSKVPYLNQSILKYLETHAFGTITALAVMPNFTFDMCGMASGFLGIPLSTFLGASFIGKALIKAPIEAYVVMFVLDDYINEYAKDEYGQSSSWFSYGYNTLFYGTMAYFIKCVVDKMASMYNENQK